MIRIPGARSTWLIGLLAALFAFGLLRVFDVQFSSGILYPEYSSLRSRPEGTKLLYDSLARTPGMTVSRSLIPLEYVNASDAAIFILNNPLAQLTIGSKPYLETIEKLARRGNRMVVALSDTADVPLKPGSDILEKRWQAKLSSDPDLKHAHPFFFQATPEWQVIDRAGDKVLAMSRNFDKGSVMLLSESDAFRNSATVKMDRLALVTAALGNYQRIIFDEQHLGVSETGTVVGLIRRFRLTGLAIGLAVCAALFIWKNASNFPPPVEAPRSEALAGRTSMSGLVTLLHRYVKPDELASVCWNEWLAGHRGGFSTERVARAQAVLAGRAGQPLEAAREIQTVLHAKGPL